MFWRSLGTLVLFFLLSAPAHSAQRTFISAGAGSDANPCSRQLPCRNFAAAILQTDPDGEVVVLDSGGYGVVLIGGPISLIAPPGVHAAITAFSGSAVEISAGSSDVVVLRGLYLNAIGGEYGIRFLSGRTLHVESCVISGFNQVGLAGSASDADVRVKDTISRENNVGFYFEAATGSIRASVDGIRVAEQSWGVFAGTNSRVMVTRSLAAGNTIGFGAGDSGEIVLESCIATHNTNGVFVTGTVRVSRTMITGNSVALGGTGIRISFGNNSVNGNTNNGTFTSTVGQQ